MYTWEYFSALAEEQADALPREAVVPFLDLLEALAEDPWNLYLPPGVAVERDKPLRTVSFGPDGTGLLTFQIYDPELMLYIVQVVWLG